MVYAPKNIRTNTARLQPLCFRVLALPGCRMDHRPPAANLADRDLRETCLLRTACFSRSLDKGSCARQSNRRCGQHVLLGAMGGWYQNPTAPSLQRPQMLRRSLLEGFRCLRAPSASSSYGLRGKPCPASPCGWGLRRPGIPGGPHEDTGAQSALRLGKWVWELSYFLSMVPSFGGIDCRGDSS